MSESDLNAVESHRSWVEVWMELSRVARAGYPGPLTEEQRGAYLAIPDVLDRCKESYERIPPPLRPFHYLTV